MAKRKPCAVPLCPAWRKPGAYLCAAHAKEQTTPKAHKYGAVATTTHGIRFASKAEAARYADLLLLSKAGRIQGLLLQPAYPLMVNGVTIGAYVADFCYYDRIANTHVIEDVKGVRTPLYRWKSKHLTAQYGYVVTEIG